MKKNKLNNGGFVLVETLVVSTFIMAIFAILYNNFYPLIGEYEKREVYDDIDGKYATYWIKRIIQDSSVNFSSYDAVLTAGGSTTGFFKFNCDMVGDSVKKEMCLRIVESAQVEMGKDMNGNSTGPNIYVTTYNLADFKEKLDNGATGTESFSGGTYKYVMYLPEYKVASLNNAQYRVIVEFHRTRDDNDYLAYSTFEVKK